MRHSQSTSTIIVGQHTLLRGGLAALLQHSTYKVIASVGCASDLGDVRATPGRQPLAILTIDDTLGSAAEAADNIRSLRTRFTSLTIVVVAETRNPVDVQQIASLAPDAYIANLTSRELLLKVLDLLALAHPIFVLSSVATTSSSSERQMLDPLGKGDSNGRGPNGDAGNARNGAAPMFSQRERQILCQLSRGSSNKEIARLFSITESTVKVHLKALLRKIGARNRTQAAIWAVANDHSATTISKLFVEHSQHPIAADLISQSAM